MKLAGDYSAATLLTLAVLTGAGVFPASIARAQINVVRDLGCKLDDFNFDNGPILNAAFARVGQVGQGGLNEEFYIPGGALVFKTPLVLPRKSGVSIRGNGITLALPEGDFRRAEKPGGPASRLVYVGPSDKPAITYPGMGLRIDGLTIQRGAYPSPPAGPVRDGSIGLMITGYNGIPTGKICAPQLAFIRFDTAIYVSAKPAENHGDQNQFGYIWAQSCATVYRSDNFQSVCNQFQFLSVGGDCDTVFDVRRGGDLIVDTLVLNAPALVLKIRDAGGNTNNFEIRSLKGDNNAAGFRLIEMQKPRAVRIHIRGNLGKTTVPAPNAIKLMGDPEYQDVVVDLYWLGKHWPADFQEGMAHPPIPQRPPRTPAAPK